MSMHLKDFLRRYIVLVLGITTVMLPLPFLTGERIPFSLICMLVGAATVMIDQSMGVARVRTVLPTTVKERSRIAWVQGVVLFPGLYAFILVPCLSCLFLMGQLDLRGALLELGLPVIGMGYSSVLFLLFWGLYPTPGCFSEQMRTFLLAVAFLFIFMASQLLFLERTVEHLLLILQIKAAAPRPDQLEGILVLASLLLTIVGFLFSQKVYEAMPLRPKSPAGNTAPERMQFRSRFSGCIAPWLRTAGVALALTAVTVTGLVLFERLLILIGIPKGNEDAFFMIFVIMLSTPCLLLLTQCAKWAGAMRGLRMLPLSRLRLTALLLSFFVLCTLIAGTGYLVLVHLLSYGNPLHAATGYVLIFVAWGCPSLLLFVRFGGPGTFTSMVVLGGAPILIWAWLFPDHGMGLPVVAEPMAVAVILLSALALYYVIGNSSGAYKRKPLLEDGPFGQP